MSYFNIVILSMEVDYTKTELITKTILFIFTAEITLRGPVSLNFNFIYFLSLFHSHFLSILFQHLNINEIVVNE